MPLLEGEEQHFEFLDQVRVPGFNLIGGEHQGWQVVNTVYEQEHGGRGQVAPADSETDSLVEYVKESKRNGGRLGESSIVRQETASAYLGFHVSSILGKRTHSLYTQRVEMTYEGSLQNLARAEASELNHQRVRDVMGMYAMLGTQDALAPHGGVQAVPQVPGCGSSNITKLIIARRIGISRTRERAFATPATATKYST